MCSDDGLNVPLHDSALHDEMTLLVALMIAANESATPLAQGEVDCLLGVRPRAAVVHSNPEPRRGIHAPGLSARR